MMKKYIKSPLNYVGGKFKLLEEMLALFPENINTFIDLFGGGFNVGVNILSKHTVYNDVETNVTNLLKHLYTNDVNEVLVAIDSLIEKFNLSKDFLCCGYVLILFGTFNIPFDEQEYFLIVCLSIIENTKL